MIHYATSLRVCILSFNHPQITQACVKSVIDLGLESKIILCHNGSRKENVQLLKSAFPNIEHFEIENNYGFSGGANRMLTFAFQKTDWIFFLTNDCILKTAPTPPSIPGLYAPLILRRKMTMVDSIGARFRPIDQNLMHFRDQSAAHKILSKKTPFLFQKFFGALYGYFYVPGTAFYIDRETFSKSGGFDETLHTYWEDVDLSVRIQQLRLHIGIEPKTEVLHKVGKTCHKDPFYTRHLFQRNKKIVSSRYNPFRPTLSVTNRELQCSP